MQAIETRWLEPRERDAYGARIIARADAGRVILDWDDRFDVEQNHVAAALALCDKLGWTPKLYGRLVSGAMPGKLQRYAHVHVGKGKR